MSRAAIVIGVNRTTGLPELRGAAADATAFDLWLKKQGVESSLFTDEGGKALAFATIFDEVARIVETRRYTQLIVYFAGHGFRSPGSEVWLLSGAPRNASEAIGLEASIMAARESGLTSVVFVSDACRSIPATAEQSRIDGGSIFPNLPINGNVRPKVDRFFATLPSMVAVEAAQADDGARRNGIFTREFIRVHHDTPSEFVARVDEEGRKLDVIMNRQLGDLVRHSVEDAVYEVAPAAGQLPEPIIESVSIYIGRVERDPTRAIVFDTTRREVPGRLDILGKSPPGAKRKPVPPAPPRRRSLASLAEEAVRQAAGLGTSEGPRVLLGNGPEIPELRALQEAARRYGAPAQTDHFETETGFAVTGATVKQAASSSFTPELLGDELIRLKPKREGLRAGSLALRFGTGTGTALPILQGFIGQIFVADGLVTHVNYLPSANSSRGQGGAKERERLQKLRSAVAAAASLGVFRVDRQDAKAFGNSVRMLKGVDPTLGIYAAYAYAGGGALEEIESMREIMREDLGADLFDVAMLAETGIDARSAAPGTPVVPFCPMLRQGWALMPVRDPRVEDLVRELRADVLPALWTSFAPDGMTKLFSAVEQGGLR